MMDINNDENKRWIAEGLAADLRRLADRIEQHPELAQFWLNFTRMSAHVFAREERKAVVKALGDLVTQDKGGEAGWRKTYLDSYVTYLGVIGELSVSLTMDREMVCRKVVKGVRRVVIPEQEYNEEDVEWICSEPAEDGE